MIPIELTPIELEELLEAISFAQSYAPSSYDCPTWYDVVDKLEKARDNMVCQQESLTE
jgi:hypothetical protein